MGDNGEHEPVVRVQTSLIEEKSSVQDRQIGTVSDVCNYLRLKWKQIEIREHQVIELGDIHDGAILLFAFRV